MKFSTRFVNIEMGNEESGKKTHTLKSSPSFRKTKNSNSWVHLNKNGPTSKLVEVISWRLKRMLLGSRERPIGRSIYIYIYIWPPALERFGWNWAVGYGWVVSFLTYDIGGAICSQGWCIFLVNEERFRTPESSKSQGSFSQSQHNPN